MNILFIAHRMPYPPNKGDKIRSYHILRHLALRHAVYLATLIDDSNDLQHVQSLSSLVNQLSLDVIHPAVKRLLSSLALLQYKPISAAYFYSRKLQAWIDNLLDTVDMDLVFCSSSPTAEYLFRSRHNNGKLKRSCRIMDLMDVDSCKWRQYAERATGPMQIIYRLEAKALLRYEERIAGEFERLLLVSEAEKALFTQHITVPHAQTMNNGVDLEYFSPSLRSSLKTSSPTLVFTGAMDYWPNVEGVEWFSHNVLPRIQTIFPKVTFYVVGRNPAASLRKLAGKNPGVKVTGYVKDVRDYLAPADLCVAPLRIARGIQNKVLEAMAMAKAVVCTPEALEGIDAHPGEHVIEAGDAPSFADAVVDLLGNKARAAELGRQARLFVEEHFSWPRNLSLLDDMLSTLSAHRGGRS
ncbi:TIGR03087 family PEP-CTERM/XrtA system glycosyltransferase [Desulforhabdus sp. TSK]|uniref:TIGR03087 family PEP-CTERM/XrtA system glycosyltransferase n=1 Tax=Desulforhabdus sp. TSK TaxID=2925014 RepID=UPI001FC826F7|nr:TIGR03087 family PEP-CTERM/XrtA system glycosyltransferase [Desulforhabdus sp. TSK]GKT11011.1 glycosyl transferase [Desulforhabdus sp. TSK]